MRQLLMFFVVILGLTNFTYAQPCVQFADVIATEKTGVKGTVNFDNATLKTCGFDDVVPKLKKGAHLELLSSALVKDDSEWGLYHLKVKVIDDNEDGDNNGKVGYMYPTSTTFAGFANYTTQTIDVAALKENPNRIIFDGNFIDILPTEPTGLKGTVEYNESALKQYDFEDVNTILKKGTPIELLNFKMIVEPTGLNLTHIKVKVLKGRYKGQVGYMYPSSTSFMQYADYSNSRIDLTKEVPAKPEHKYKGRFIDFAKTEKTGTTGVVTYDGGSIKVKGFDDDRLYLKYGAKIELLSYSMITENSADSPYLIKVKVLNDMENGKKNKLIGYMYPASTSFSIFANYDTERIETPKGFIPAMGNDAGDDVFAVPPPKETLPPKGQYTIPNFANEKTGLSGEVDGGLGDAWAYLDGGDWAKELYLKSGTKFELLSKQIFKDALTQFYFIKIKVTFDPEKTYSGKIVWVNVDETTLAPNADKTSLIIN